MNPSPTFPQDLFSQGEKVDPFSAQTPFFKREGELQRFTRQVSFKSPQLFAPITGPIGCGKRTLALQFIQRYHALYTSVFWIPAATQSEIIAAYHRIAKVLKIKDTLCSLTSLLAAIQEKLKGQRCLYVFNNAPSATILTPFLFPEADRLIISLHSSPRAWPRPPFHIAPFSDQEILEFIDYYQASSMCKSPAFDLFLRLISPYPLALFYTLTLIKKTPTFSLHDLLATIQAQPPLFRALLKNSKNCAHYYQLLRHLVSLLRSNSKNRL